MHIFFTPDITQAFYRLSEQESKHCARVLRLKVNDFVSLIDGRGGFYTAKICDASPKAVQLEIIEEKKNYGKRNYKIHIAIAPTKNIDRFKFFLEKTTEIGIDEITPIICAHSERRVVKTDKLEATIIAAIKQSIKAYKPTLHQAVDYKKFIKQNFDGKKYIAHCASSETKLPLQKISQAGENVLIMIGPEGDFSAAEILEAINTGFDEVSLGNSRLRTETAGIAACHTLSLLNESF